MKSDGTLRNQHVQVGNLQWQWECKLPYLPTCLMWCETRDVTLKLDNNYNDIKYLYGAYPYNALSGFQSSKDINIIYSY